MAVLASSFAAENRSNAFYARWAIALSALTLVVGAVAAVVVVLQLDEARAAISVQNDISISSLLFGNDKNIEIIGLIETKKPILVEHGGSISDAQLENYLGTFETIDGAYLDGQLAEPILCDSYSYFIVKTFEAPEVRNYIAEQRQEDQNFFGGLDELYSAVRKSHEPNCHPAPTTSSHGFTRGSRSRPLLRP